MSNRGVKWYKEVGGDSGAILAAIDNHNRKWHWFECLWCAKMTFPNCFKTDRWQGPPSPAITRARKLSEMGHKIPCHGAILHKQYIKEKSA